MKNKKTLKLNLQEKRFLGVCAGIADYLAVEPWAVRLVFFVSVFFGAWFLVPLYFVAWFLLDEHKGGGFKCNIVNHDAFTHFKNVDYKKTIYRNREEGKFLGVCAGVADYLEVNAFVVRMLTLITFFLTGFIAVLAYFGAYFILSDKPPRSDYEHDDGDYGISREKLRSKHYSARSDVKSSARRFSNLQDRLARIEAYVTSKQFRLNREFRDIS